MNDLRTAQARDADMLARLKREGGFSRVWLFSNRDRSASLHRLIAAGEVDLAGPDWVAIKGEPSWLERFTAWCKGVTA